MDFVYQRHENYIGGDQQQSKFASMEGSGGYNDSEDYTDSDKFQQNIEILAIRVLPTFGDSSGKC